MEESRDRRARSDAVQDSYLWRRRTSGSFGATPEATGCKRGLPLSAVSGHLDQNRYGGDYANSARSVAASLLSGVAKPSLNQP
jgi:hypothetical protein